MRAVMVIAAVVVALVAGPVAGRGEEPIRVGAVNPYSGPLAQFGDEVARGYELAAEAVNAKGGIGGRKILIVRGDAGTAQQGIATVDNLLSQEHCDVLLGTYISAVSNAASDAAARYGRVYWETHALAADLTERGLTNFFRAGPNAQFFAETSVKGARDLVAKRLGKPASELKVWIEHEESIYGSSIAAVQQRLLTAAGMKIVGVGAHSFRAIDLTDSILRAKQAAPDLWISTGYVPDNTLLLRTMKDQDFRPPAVMLLGTGDGTEFRDAFGSFLDGVLVVGYPHADLPESYAPGAATFLTAYKAKFNRDPVAPQSLEAYAGANMLFDVIAAAGSVDLDKVRAAALAMDKPLHSYANGFGLKFDAKQQNALAIPNIVQWQSGRTVTVYPGEAEMPGTTLVNLPREN